MRWVSRIGAAMKVRAMTGSRDDTTPAPLARDFVAKLQARGIDARFQEVSGVGHIELMSSSLLLDAVHAVIQDASAESVALARDLHVTRQGRTNWNNANLTPTPAQ